jgi:predicted esterase
VTVYGDQGPFRRWLRWLPSHPEVDAETAASEIMYQVEGAMQADDALGADGEWAGLLGFSQGAKVSASLLYTQQVVRGRFGAGEPGMDNGKGAAAVNWRFGVLMAGRAPLVMLDDRVPPTRHVADASMGSTSFTDWPEGSSGTQEHLLRLPTIHVHGMRDPGLEHHLRLLNDYCAKGTTRVVEWDGDHRIPIRSQDVDRVTGQILELGRELGIVKE